MPLSEIDIGEPQPAATLPAPLYPPRTPAAVPLFHFPSPDPPLLLSLAASLLFCRVSFSTIVFVCFRAPLAISLRVLPPGLAFVSRLDEIFLKGLSSSVVPILFCAIWPPFSVPATFSRDPLPSTSVSIRFSITMNVIAWTAPRTRYDRASLKYYN